MNLDEAGLECRLLEAASHLDTREAQAECLTAALERLSVVLNWREPDIEGRPEAFSIN